MDQPRVVSWGDQANGHHPSHEGVMDDRRAQRITFEFVSSLPLEFICTLITHPHEAD